MKKEKKRASPKEKRKRDGKNTGFCYYAVHYRSDCDCTDPLMQKALENLLDAALGVVEGEVVAFIYDSAYRPLVDPIRTFAEGKGIHLSTLEIEYDGIAPISEPVRLLLRGEQHQIILFGVVHNIWHSPERKESNKTSQHFRQGVIMVEKLEALPRNVAQRRLEPFSNNAAALKPDFVFSTQVGAP